MLKGILQRWLSIGRSLLSAIDALFRFLKKLVVYGLMLFIPLVILWATIGKITDALEFRDDDPSRGAASIVNDPIDSAVDKEHISYLDQNWSAEDSLWFYRTSQGSNLLPYAFFLHLEQPGNTNLIRDNEYVNSFRYLPQDPTPSNPDGLAVGMAKDTYQGKEYMGFSCAACHTNQIHYTQKGTTKGIRIDGAPAAVNLETFLVSIAVALEETLTKPEKLQRFIANVKDEKGYSSEPSIKADLDYFAVKIRSYVEMNEPFNSQGSKTHYGFSRLDAFGRIYNRVMQYVLDGRQLKVALKSSLPRSVWQQAGAEIESILNSKDQTDLLIRSMVVAEKHRSSASEAQWNEAISRLRETLFNSSNAPASYPYLWDVAQHDFVQWTGSVANSGIGPLGRNVGQVIGVFGSLDWQRKSNSSLLSMLGLWHENGKPIDFKTSINKRNLRRVEQHLRKLLSPKWPSEFPALDHEKVNAGQKIFQQRCVSCHANMNPQDPARRIVANISSVEHVGTDPMLADNAVSYTGFSGLLQNKYVDAGLGDLLIEERQQTAALVRYSARKVVKTPDADVGFIRGWAEWTWDILKTFGNNEIQSTIRKGNYNPPTTAQPFNHIRSYKARPLNGIWATAPYLHNGAVPNLYELLLPKRGLGDPEFDAQGQKIEYRSDQFYVGSRQFDFDKIGFNNQAHEQAFKFDTRLPGNANTGHEYAAGRTPNAQGKLFTPLNKQQRYQLLEYLKSL